MQRLLKAPDHQSNLLVSGLALGLEPEITPFWADGHNVVFRGTGPEAISGWEIIEALTTAPTAIAQAVIESERRIYFGNSTGLYVYRDGTRSAIGTGFSSANWSFATWGSWLAAVNGVDGLQLWKNGVLVTPNTRFTTAKIVRRLGAQLLAFNLDSGENRVEWCHDDDVETWAVAQTNTAGGLTLRELDGPILAVEPLGNGLAVYTDSQMGMLSYIGQPFFFGFDVRLTGVGVVSKNAVAIFGDTHYGLSKEGFWRADGNQWAYIDMPLVQEYLQTTLNWEFAHKVVCYHDSVLKGIVLSFPTGTSEENDTSLLFNYQNNTWSKLTFGRSAASSVLAYDYPITADGNGIYYQSKGSAAGGSVLTSSIETALFDFGDANKYKLIQALRIGSSGTLEISLGTAEDFDDTVDWYWTSEVDRRLFPLERENPLFALKFEGTGAWTLSSVEILGYVGGDVL